jgi:CHAD domain-containing protein
MAPVEGFDLLRERAGAARERAWQAAVDELASPSFKAFQDDVAALALDWGGALLLGPASAELLDTHLSKSRKRAKGLARKTAAERHRLRIALKKLRYTCEFFAPLYNPKKVEAFVAPLKELQDLLGHLNDAAQVRAVLGRVMMEEATSAREQADLSHAAGLIQGYHQARAEIVADKMLKRWKRFKKAEPFWI